MLDADSMPRSHDAALQQRECGFNGVGVNLTHDIDVALMLDSLVSSHSATAHSVGIGRPFVGDNYVHIVADVFADEMREGCGLGIFRVKESQITITLPNPDHSFFVVHSTALPEAALFSSDIGFVNFDHAIKFGLSCFEHCGPDTMTEIPSGFVGLDSQGPLNLAG